MGRCGFWFCVSLLWNYNTLTHNVSLQQIPGVSPTGQFTTAVPLLLVLLATAVKEIIEDLVRPTSYL